MTERVRDLLEDARKREIFSGAAWSFGTADGEVAGGVLGTTSWGGAPVDGDTVWDLASVTKPIVGLAVMSLVERGELDLDDTVADHLPQFAASDKAPLTVRQLLTHTSGIPGQVPMYRWCHTRDELLAAIRDVPVAFPAGTSVTYSSQGFVLLGLIAEAVSGIGLDALVAERVTTPVGMARTGFGVAPELRERAAATEDCPWRGRVVQGTVHDENAEVLGGVAGHAGLFAAVGDLARLGVALCRDGSAERGWLLSPATLALMIEPATDHLPLRRSLAWQGRDRVGSPAGDLAGPRTYGHTGFTGTCLWVDPDLGGYLVLLTNRVHPSREPRGFERVRRSIVNVAFAELSARR
jgi:CubicO group peptidase (beta-lactamase class C family)